VFLTIIVGVAGTIALASWGYLQKWTKDFIIDATVLELNKRLIPLAQVHLHLVASRIK
jgi:hypothetical protein